MYVSFVYVVFLHNPIHAAGAQGIAVEIHASRDDALWLIAGVYGLHPVARLLKVTLSRQGSSGLLKRPSKPR
jgi:hypothetical protein